MSSEALKTTLDLHHRWWNATYALTQFQWANCHCAALPSKVGERCGQCKGLATELEEAETALRAAGEWEQWARKHE